jgi:hypothetical protein
LRIECTPALLPLNFKKKKKKNKLEQWARQRRLSHRRQQHAGGGLVHFGDFGPGVGYDFSCVLRRA